MLEHGTKTMLAIVGMRDNACRERVAEALKGVNGVHEAHVSLIRARAVVFHARSCDPLDLVCAVVCAGYGASIAAPEARWLRDNRSDGGRPRLKGG